MATLPMETLLNSQLLRNPSPVSAGPRKHTANLVLGSQGLWTKGVVRLNVARSSPGIGCTRRRRCRTWAGVGQLEKKVVLESTGKEKETDSLLRVGIICGGPSAERGISLNSARSVLDHLQRAAEVTCYYLDTNKRPYAISTAQMYSNTPSDFDFKLGSTAQSFETMEAFLEHLRSSVDIVFPVLHGKFGEDGGIQDLLEGAGLPFVGTGSVSAQRAFDKYEASQELCRQGFVTVPSFLVQATGVDVRSLSEWFASNQLDPTTGRVVVKPACAGSSVGVSIAFGVQDATKRAEALLSEGIDDRVIVEVFMEGVEFTAVVLDVGFGTETHPVTLMPTEVELRSDGGSEEASIFDYRKKYLPSRQVSYHTPPRFPRRAVQEIRDGAAKLFQQLGLKDFARFDGWYVPSSSTARAVGQGDPKKKRIGEFEEGFIVFTDINLISGMEQTSFLFQQASQVGLSHADVLRMVLSHACSRFSIRLPRVSEKESSRDPIARVQSPRRKVYVIFGGESSERQVSLISGTNVWLNLCGSPDLDVQPFLLTPSSMRSPSQEMLDTPSNHDVWALPYSLVLRHTVEEVLDCCREALQPDRAATVAELRKEIVSELREWQRDMLWAEGSVKFEAPRQISLLDWIKEAKEENAVVFIAVHGGIGENGTLQALLDSQGVLYTGSGAQASRLCANKAATGLALSHLAHLGVLSAAKELSATSELLASLDLHDESRTQVIAMWDDLSRRLQAKTICVKPVGDGCSTGVARLCCAEDLNLYLRAVHEGVPRLLPGTLSEAHGIVEMPVPPPGELLFEEFIETNPIIVASQSMLHGEVAGEGLFWKGLSRWIEVTIGVIGRKNQMRSFNPSITVKESGSILTLEEKFQGGTGVNLTPPPPSLVSKEAIAAAKQRIELVARTLDLEGFARIDAFLHADTGEIIVIEANTIPGMTPSTVLIHQALSEDPPMYPRTFFRAALDLALPS